MVENKNIILCGQEIWFGDEKLGIFEPKNYKCIIDLFVSTGGCKRGNFNEIIALPKPENATALLEQLRSFLVRE